MKPVKPAVELKSCPTCETPVAMNAKVCPNCNHRWVTPFKWQVVRIVFWLISARIIHDLLAAVIYLHFWKYEKAIIWLF